MNKRAWAGYAVALALVGAVSGAIGLVLGRSDTRVANISMSYLVAVLVTAVLFGRGPAIAASIAAFIAFDWFFVEPLHQLTVEDPDEYVALILFLLVAVVTGTLASSLRERARDATARSREATVLYDVVRLLAESDEPPRAITSVLARLREELALAAAALEPVAAGIAPAAAGDAEALRALRAASALVLAPPPASAGRARWIRIVPAYARRRASAGRAHAVPVTANDRRLATLLVLRPEGSGAFHAADERLLAAAAGQIGAALERARLRREATEAELLRRTDELKTALLDAVSHDLRTPLASIIAAVGSLRQREIRWTEEQRAELTRSIEDEARRLDRLVGDLLDLSRIEAGAFTPRKAWYDLGALIDDVVGRLRPVTLGRQVRVLVPDDLPPIELDYVEIDQVLSNLIENAAKYSPPGSEIEIAAAVDGQVVRVEVADRGPGVPRADARDVFAPFRRLGRDLRTTGAGLGLAIARRLVEAHGGTIGVEPRSGGGSRFVFTLPR
ncbi:MAG TPA: DUF4118 domain-containing protein [Candidatus Limnocylindria bacterium]|nr:DUF4118 domain-containing protein [Candidatus Limnocylindria bacterium]